MNIPSVLAVDDNLDNVQLISYVLEVMNVRCYGTKDSRKVAKLAIDIMPKLILLDIVMPVLSGFDILKQLKSNKITKNIPVIAVTGLVDLAEETQLQKAGFDDYIYKPFVLEELEAKIARHLNYSLLESVA